MHVLTSAPGIEENNEGFWMLVLTSAPGIEEFVLTSAPGIEEHYEGFWMLVSLVLVGSVLQFRGALDQQLVPADDRIWK